MPNNYHNAYILMQNVRLGLNEYSSGFVQYSDTSGAFDNILLMQHINEAQRFLFNITFVRGPEDYITSSALTPSASVVTLPSDFFKLRRLEITDTKRKISPITIDEKHQTNESGSQYLYRWSGRKSITIDKDSFTDSVTAWYYKRPRDLHYGQAQSGSTTNSLVMEKAKGARTEADYYNGMTVEIDITDALVVSEISDYTAAYVATVSGAVSSSDWYGLVPEIPEDFHHLIAPKAVLLMKNHVKSPVPYSPKEENDFNAMLQEALRAYYGTSTSDVPYEDIFLDLQPFY